MNALQNTIKATKNLVGAGVSIVGVTAQVAADGAVLIKDSIEQAVPVAKAVLAIPFNITEGVLVENGMDSTEAHDKAYRYVNQPLAVTIGQIGVVAGTGLAALLKEENMDAAVALIEEEADKQD